MKMALLKRFWLSLGFISSLLQLSAVVLTGIGWGENPEQAKNSALSELSSTIYVQVQSKLTEINSEVDYKASSKTLKEITLESNLPIMGAEYSTPLKQKGRYSVTATLNPQTAAPVYETRLRELLAELQQAKTALSATQSTEVVYQQLLNAKVLLETFTVYKLVYSAMGGHDSSAATKVMNTLSILDELDEPDAAPASAGVSEQKTLPEKFEAPFTANEVDTAIARLQQSYDDLQFALKSIAKTFGSYKNIYPHYPSVYPSDEVTQFSRLVRSTLANLVNSVEEPVKAEFFLVSSYEILNDKIVQNLRLIDRSGNLKAEAIINLNPPAYSNTEYKPRSMEIAQALEMRDLISNDLRIELSTLQGKNMQLFTKGQEVKFMVKVNQPCQFYIASHVHQENDDVYSYLLSLYPSAQGDARYVFRVAAEDCNRWLELSGFVATEPFGVEILHVIATNGEIEKMVPSTEFDMATGLFKLSDKPKEAIVAMRGLKPKEKGTETAESTLTLTIMKN